MIILQEADGSTHTFSGKTLFVFIDDTGHELFQDNNYPIFGFGGCLCLVEDYQKQIREPWAIVEGVFEPKQLPLHATDIGVKNKTNKNQYDAINQFFSSNTFGRFACVISNNTINTTPYPYLNLVSAILYKRIEAIMKWLPFERVVYLIEDTEDLERKEQVANSFSGFTLTDEDNKRNIPMDYFFMPKKANEAGLIVADFVAHTAGTTVRDKKNGKIQAYLERPDFKNIFDSIDIKWASFSAVDSMGN